MAITGGGERDLTIKLLANVSDFKRNMSDAENQTQTFGSRVGDGLKKVGIAVAAAAAAAGAFAVKFGVDAVKAASDLSETVSKVNVLFGDSASKVEKFAESAARNFGQSKQQALDAAATFATFGGAAGLSGDALVKFSTDFTGLASDLASFNNTSPEQAINAIGAALRGEAEPIRQYGVLLNEATLKQAALELGIISTTNQALTPQQKVLAAQKVIYDQTSAAQGDFARTSDGLANQQRILGAEFENVKTVVGNALLPVATELFKIFNDKVVPAAQKLADEFNTKARPALEKVSEIVKKDLLPILQVWWEFLFKDLIPTIGNALKPVIEAIITGLKFLVDKVKENRDGFEIFLGILNKVWEFIKTYVIPLFRDSFVAAVQAVFNVIGFLIDAFGKVFEIIGKIAKFLGFDLSFELDKATGKISEQTSKTADAYREFQNYSRQVTEEVIPTTTNLTGAVGDLTGATEDLGTTTLDTTSATDKFTASTKKSTEAIKEQFTALEALDLIRAGFGNLLGKPELGSANFQPQLPGGETFRSAAELIGQFGGKIVGFNAKPDDPFYGFTKGDVLGVFQKGVAGVAININVNGTVLDPEGTARAISDVLVRSGGRAGNLPLGAILGVE